MALGSIGGFLAAIFSNFVNLGLWMPVGVLEGAADDVLESADVVVTASGTATVQTAIHERPMVIVGGGGWSAQACRDIRAFIEANGLPVCASFRNQDLFDNRHPNYAGDLGVGVGPALGKRLKASDLIIAVGPRLGEATTGGYTLFDLPVPKQKLVHVHASAEELGRVYQATLPINSGMQAFAAAAKAMKPVDSARWKNTVAESHAEYLDNIKPGPLPGTVNMGEVIKWLNGRLPEDAIVTNGAGNYAAFLHRFFQYKGFKTQLELLSGTDDV